MDDGRKGRESRILHFIFTVRGRRAGKLDDLSAETGNALERALEITSLDAAGSRLSSDLFAKQTRGDITLPSCSAVTATRMELEREVTLLRNGR